MAFFTATHADSIDVSAPVAIDRQTQGLAAVRRLFVALHVRRQRKALLSLDDRMLSDIGLSRADVHREAHRSFMDLPANMPRNTW